MGKRHSLEIMFLLSRRFQCHAFLGLSIKYLRCDCNRRILLDVRCDMSRVVITIRIVNHGVMMRRLCG